MANFYSPGWDVPPNGGAGYRLLLRATVQAQNPEANTSTVRFELYLEKDRSFSGFYGYTDTEWSLTVDGTPIDGSLGVAVPSGPWTKWLGWLLSDKTVTIVHDSDGGKVLNFSAHYDGADTGWAIGFIELAGALDLGSLVRATVPTVAPSPAAVGATVTVNLPRVVGTYKHDVTWVSGNLSGTIGTDLDTVTTWTVPDVMGEFPGDLKAPITITVVTKTGVGGTALGSKQVTLFVQEPPAPPTINAYDPAAVLDIRVRRVVYTEDDEWVATETVDASGVTLVDPASATATSSITLNKIVAIDYPEQSVIDIDVWDGENWRFTNHRFVLNRNDGDDIDPVKAFTFSGTEFIDYMLGVAYTQKDYEWENVTPGKIMADLISDAKGRGWGPRMGVNFSATKTSLDETWANTIPERKVSKGTPLSQVLDGLVTDGFAEYRTRYNTNTAWLTLLNPGTGDSFTDVGAPVVVNFALADLSRAPRRGDASKRITRVTVAGDDKIQQTRERAPFDSSVFGALEGWVSASGVTTDAAAQTVGDNALRDNFAVVSERTFEYDNTAAPQYHPYLRFAPGDWVLIPQGDGIAADRVSQVTIDKRIDSFKITALTGDRILSGMASLAKRQSAQVGGSISGGNGTSPSPLDSRIPSAPVVDEITSEGYWNLDGAARSSVTLSWAAITEALNGANIPVDLYEVWSRAALGEEWALRATTDELVVTMENFDPLSALKFRVRGRSAAGIFGEFSEDQEITTAQPTTDLDGPDLADLYTDGVGGIYAVWGGTLDGVPAPSRVAYVVAELSSDGGTTYVAEGTPIVAAGTIQINKSGAWGDYEVRLRAFDRLGNPGDASDPQSITITDPHFDPATPAAPTGLSGTAGAAWGVSGYLPEAWIDLTWDLVDEDTDGNPVEVVGYDVLGLRSDESVERFLTSTATNAARLTVGNGELWRYRVRATSNFGGVGAPSDAIDITADATISAASAPTAPVLDQYAGLLRIKWSGGGMVPQIKYVYAAISTTLGGTYVRAGMPLQGAGEIVVPGLATDQEYYAKIIMVDELGTTSASAAAGPILLLPITGVTIQTSEVANTGIKITNSGLTAYDVSGNPTFVLNADTGEVWIAPYDAVFDLGASGVAATTGSATTGIAISSANSSFNTFIHPSGVQIRNDQTALSWWEADASDAGLVNFFSPRAAVGTRLRVGDYEFLKEAKPTGSRLVVRYKGL